MGGFAGGGNHGNDEKKRRGILSKPNYFQKNFEKSSKERSKIPHVETHATPQELQLLRQRLKKEKLKKSLVNIITLLVSTAILYLLWLWIN